MFFLAVEHYNKGMRVGRGFIFGSVIILPRERYSFPKDKYPLLKKNNTIIAIFFRNYYAKIYNKIKYKILYNLN